MATWKIDPMHSEVQFKVKHLMISTVTGDFKAYDATVETADDDSFENAQISFTAQIDSISTGNEQRDGHLKSGEFFDAEAFPTLTFVSTSYANEVLKGNLTIKDVTKSVELDAEFGGLMTDFYGQTKAGFEISGKINRKDFGLTWSAVTEAGGVVVSDDVKLILNVQLTKQA
ncbi:polyisoprenoid-binding protein [Lacihabitans sp. CCS-44]|uniref:YceI family protein n=1 Tax=Lacihabitans sp. CCS-44 TaxID=2487331 RepID=UPI0020CD22E1|nr:YceI family protein [Lacihabitans sp. CCS-44]MCP9755239.1 polyisoprenoid-binding protein [Lacihabitans sp. CCS-44]